MSFRTSAISLAFVLTAAPLWAACLAPGQLPARLDYSDGQAEEAPQISGDLYRSTLIAADGQAQRFEATYGLFATLLEDDRQRLRWFWSGPQRLRAEEMEPGVEIAYAAMIREEIGGTSFGLRYSFVSHGPETLTVAGCEVQVIRLTRTIDLLEGGGQVISEIWFDPVRMQVWRNDKTTLDKTGAVEAQVSVQVTSITLPGG